MFEGIKIVELAQWVFVPAAGAVFSNLGAEVVKIERLGGGDPLRGLFTASLGQQSGQYNPRVEQNNSGKKSLAIDISNPEGLEILFRLIEQADVFLTNFRSSTLTRYGLDVDGVRARNPRVIYARGHGFGARGRHADRPGYDASAFWARGGVGATLTTADATDPVAMRPAFGDHTAAMNLAFGVAAALYKRERTGEPSVVDTSLLATAMWTLSSDVLSAFNPGYVGGATTRAPQQSPLAGTFKTADGRWIALVFMEPDRYWDPFCRHIGRADLAVDDRFREGGARTQNARECLAILAEVFASRDYEEWRHIVAELDAPWEPMQSVKDLYDDEQVLANGYLPTINDRDDHVVAIPTQFDGELEVPARAPEYGEHTEQVLLDLGLEWDELTKLKDAKVILEMAATPDDRAAGIRPSPSARRATQLLNYLAGNRDASYSVSELARALTMNRATCQSVLMGLEEGGFVRRDPRTKTYSLGAALIPLGEAALASLKVVDEARPEIERIAADTGLECIAAVSAGAEMIIVTRAGPASRFGGSIRVGHTVPICPPFGIAFVAWSDDDAIDTWLARAGSLPDGERKRYLASIDAVRQRGYSVTLEIRSRERLAQVLTQLRADQQRGGSGLAEHEQINQLLHEEYLLPEGEEPASHRLAQLSVPVFGPDRSVALVIGLTGFPHDLTSEEIDGYVAPLLGAASRVTERIHGARP